MRARRSKISSAEKGAEILFERLAEVGNLTSRDIDLLTSTASDLINKTNTAADHYQANKVCFDNFTLGNKDCQRLVSLAGKYTHMNYEYMN